MPEIHAFIYGAVALVLGSALAVGGVFVLAGPGWAMVSGSVPCLAFGLIICRGVLRAEAQHEVE